MFDIGFSEVLIIAVVALLVLGPERLPKAARFAGLWVRRARAQWYSVKAEFEREIAQEELMRQVREPFAEAMAETGAQMRALDAELSAPYISTDPLAAPASADALIAPDASDAPDASVAHQTPGVGDAQSVVATPGEDAPLQGDLLASIDPATPRPPRTPPTPPDPGPLGVTRP